MKKMLATRKYEKQGDRDDAPRSENIYLIENHCQANISKGRRGKEFNTFS